MKAISGVIISKQVNKIFIQGVIFLLMASHAVAQTCTIGTASQTTEFVIKATGASANTNNTLGAIVAAGTTLNNKNAATVSQAPSAPLMLDFGRIIPALTPISISASRVSAGNATANVEYSTDNITYTSLGASISTSSLTSTYFNYVAPIGGVRYIKITVTSNKNLFIDGARYIQNFALSASGATTNAVNATGTVLNSGSPLSTTNAASVNSGAVLTLDLERFAAAGSTVRIAASRNGANATASVAYSTDGVTFTQLGTNLSLTSNNSTYTNYTVPAGGLRYLTITGISGNSFIDGVIYNHYCPFSTINAVDDQQVVQNPGTANGNVLINDEVPSGTRSLTLVANTTKGVLNFNTTTGIYSYTPNSGFQGIDYFTYRLCDAGPDGNISTTADNICDVATVYLRTMFNCKNTVFYVPIPENEARDFLEDINLNNNDNTQVYMGLTLLTEGLIVYDHWEDGYEANITTPTQTTTQVWGDGNIENGVAPGYPTDVIPSGSTLILSNTLTSGHNNTNNYNPNAVGADNTLQATVDFDGRDKICIAGEASLTKFAWGTSGTLSMTGGAVPSTRDWGTSYILPVGRNTGAAPEPQFQVVNLSIIAKEANTVVTIDRDGNGSTDITVTLNEGETYYVDSRNNGATTAVNQGGRINATKPIQVYLMTGEILTSNVYQGRNYSLTPTTNLSNTYYMPGIPNETMRVYFYNPSNAAIVITRTTTIAGGGVTLINVPANSSVSQDIDNSGYGYKYTSLSNFMILTTVDRNSGVSDWGFIPIAANSTSPIVLASFAEGSDPTNADYGTNNNTQLIITSECTTYLYADVDGDGVADKVSFNDDLDVTDASVTIGGVIYDETTSNNGILLNAYQTVTIGGPAGSLNGARLWTKTLPNNAGTYGCDIVAIWGQNGGPAAAPNIDAGYTLPKTLLPLDVVVTKPAAICPNSGTSQISALVLNGAAPFTVLVVNTTTLESQYITSNTNILTLNSNNPGDYTLKINDNNCLSYETSFRIDAATNCLAISGNVYNDANGLTDAAVNGVGFNLGGSLFANLISYTGNVLANIPVAANGTYNFASLNPGNYFVQVSTIQGVTASPAPEAVLPTNWINTGEHIGTSVGNDGTANGSILVSLTLANISNVNFGIEQRPVPANSNLAATVNPGGFNMVTIPSTAFSATDADGIVTAIRITDFPTNATSIMINGIPYTSMTFPLEGVDVPVNASGNPTQPILVDPISGAVTVSIPYVAIDNAGVISSTTGIVSKPFTALSMSGNVFNDANGLTDATVNGSGTNINGALYANLLNSLNMVVTTLPVTSTGVYSFSGLDAGSYSVQISTNQGTEGAIAPATALPTNWVNTGENIGTAAGNDGAINGNLAVALTTSNVSNANFGIEQRPFSTNNTAASQVNPGGTNNASVPATLFTATDADGTVSSIRITAFPTNATSITINGTTYTLATFPIGGVTVPTNTSGNPSQTITVDPVNGAVTVAIPYKAIDNAGFESTATSNASLPFTTLEIKGNVLNDANGLTDGKVNGHGLGKPEGVPLFVNLLDDAGTVIGFYPLLPNGKYEFENLNGGNYTLQLSPTQGILGGLAPITPMPTHWENTGENLGANSGNDGVANGKLSFTLINQSLEDLNLGINKRPKADNKSYSLPFNPPYGSIMQLDGVSNIPSPLTGLDYEDGLQTTNSKFIITNIDGLNGSKLLYDGVLVSNNTIINNYNPSLLSVEYWGNTDNLTFRYASYDAADVQGEEASYSILWPQTFPVEILDINAVLEGNDGVVRWTTSMELNTSHFEVERSLDGGFSFEYVGTEQAAGNSNSALNYTFRDVNVVKMAVGKVHYRLRNVDIDNSFTYTNTIELKIEKPKVYLNLYPNPTQDVLNIVYQMYEQSVADITITNMLGQIIHNELRTPSNESTQSYQLNVQNLAPGTYFLQINTETKSVMQKFVKE